MSARIHSLTANTPEPSFISKQKCMQCQPCMAHYYDKAAYSSYLYRLVLYQSSPLTEHTNTVVDVSASPRISTSTFNIDISSKQAWCQLNKRTTFRRTNNPYTTFRWWCSTKPNTGDPWLKTRSRNNCKGETDEEIFLKIS